ncbi:MAG: hypothetical protein AAF329_02765 [Cyanobacteria bacterium P01_A01_bin.17]
MDTARYRLEQCFTDDIVLTGLLQSQRRYWGCLNGQTLTLHGPNANKQFCFLTRGHLTEVQSQTILDIHILLSRKDIFSLLFVAILLLFAVPLMFQTLSIFLLPALLLFIYGMLQWHFQCYEKEISQLLLNIITGVQIAQES